LHPHPALSPVPDPSDQSSLAEQDANEEAWRQLLAQNVLAVLLPTEDLKNECLRALVEQILAEMIVGNVIGTRLCESWVLWELITNAIEASGLAGDTNSSKDKKPGSGNDDAARSKKKYRDETGRLRQYGLVEDANRPEEASVIAEETATSLVKTFWRLMHYGFILITTGRAVALLLLSTANLAGRGSSKSNSFGASSTADITEGAARSGVPKIARPIVDMSAWKTAANLVEIPSRMPWVSGLANLAHYIATAGPGGLGRADGRVDR
jgi:hypothetical protein